MANSEHQSHTKSTSSIMNRLGPRPVKSSSRNSVEVSEAKLWNTTTTFEQFYAYKNPNQAHTLFQQLFQCIPSDFTHHQRKILCDNLSIFQRNELENLHSSNPHENYNFIDWGVLFSESDPIEILNADMKMPFCPNLLHVERPKFHGKRKVTIKSGPLLSGLRAPISPHPTGYKHPRLPYNFEEHLGKMVILPIGLLPSTLL